MNFVLLSVHEDTCKTTSSSHFVQCVSKTSSKNKKNKTDPLMLPFWARGSKNGWNFSCYFYNMWQESSLSWLNVRVIIVAIKEKGFHREPMKDALSERSLNNKTKKQYFQNVQYLHNHSIKICLKWGIKLKFSGSTPWIFTNGNWLERSIKNMYNVYLSVV